MKTEQLLRVLIAEGSHEVIPIDRRLRGALTLGVTLSGLFLLVLHPRPDAAQALLTVPFDLKLAVVLSLACTSALSLTDAVRPGHHRRRRWPLLVSPLLLGGGLVAELATVPSHAWAPRLMGHNALHCLTLIPVLSLPPLACLLGALRRGAPMHPGRAGAIAGVLSAAVGATVYALTCPDDSPLFIATWYSTAIVIVSAAATCLGAHLLRW